MNHTTPVNVSTWTFAHQQTAGALVIIVNYAHLILLENEEAAHLIAELSNPNVSPVVEAWPVTDDQNDEGMFFSPLIIGEGEKIALDFPNGDRDMFATSVLSSPYLSLDAVEAPETTPVALNA